MSKAKIVAIYRYIKEQFNHDSVIMVKDTHINQLNGIKDPKQIHT